MEFSDPKCPKCSEGYPLYRHQTGVFLCQSCGHYFTPQHISILSSEFR